MHGETHKLNKQVNRIIIHHFSSKYYYPKS